MEVNETVHTSCKGLELCDECRNRKVELIKNWIKDEATFYGRTDDDFVLLFLYGCKFDLETTKKKMNFYYENRTKFAAWWANRNMMDTLCQSIIQLKVSSLLKASTGPNPTVGITICSRISSGLDNLDAVFKVTSVLVELIVRRPQSQRHGLVWIVDCTNFPKIFFLRHLSPFTFKKALTSFYLSCPIRLKGLVLLNTPPLFSAFYALVTPLLSAKLRSRIRLLGSDWSRLGDYVNLQLLPDEYGGCAGPLEQHLDAFVDEYFSINEYLLDDNKYGFQ